MEELLKPCIVCERLLGQALGLGWATMQPSEGGEVQFIFSYGSKKFDNNSGTTTFRGVICDDCAEEFVDKMEESGTLL